MHTRAPHLVQGQTAENTALAFLLKQGLRLIARNYRCRRGEIDLVMEHHDTLVFVEVRYRKSARFGDALESITPRKQTRLIACASHYLNTTHTEKPVRFDVVAMTAEQGQHSLQWIRDAFQT